MVVLFVFCLAGCGAEEETDEMRDSISYEGSGAPEESRSGETASEREETDRMKKFLVILLSLFFVLGLAACGSSDSDNALDREPSGTPSASEPDTVPGTDLESDSAAPDKYYNYVIFLQEPVREAGHFIDRLFHSLFNPLV